MKIYYYVIIMVGLMYTLSLAGIETNSNQIMSAISSGDFSNFGFGTFGTALIVFLGLAVATQSIRIGGFSYQGSIESAFAGLAGTIGYFFILDLYSIYTLPALEGSGWIKLVIGGIILPLCVGFIVSLAEFVRGND